MPLFKQSRQAFAKINWFLDITAQRPDGYHELSTLMQKISLADTLSLSETVLDIPDGLPQGRFACGNFVIHLSIASRERLQPDEQNTVIKAFAAYFEALPPETKALTAHKEFYIHIDKNIPSQGGLGGGSADAAAALRLMQAWVSEKGGETLSEAELQDCALKTGADVPFCLAAEAMLLCSGIGEVFAETETKAQALPLLLYFPDLKVSTPEAFGRYDRLPEEQKARIPRSQPDLFLRALGGRRLNELAGYGVNSFFYLHEDENRALRSIHERLLQAGADYAAMSGSGPSFFAVFGSAAERDRAFELLQKILGAEGSGARAVKAESLDFRTL